jgi:hypothetical protein
MAKSVRASLTMYQNPWPARKSSGTFVVAIAVEMTIKSGMDAALVQSPSNTRRPHTISNVPTKCAVKYGYGNPIRANRATPILGSMYFRMPWVRKIKPTASRISTVLAAPCGGLNKNWKRGFTRSLTPLCVRMAPTLFPFRRLRRSNQLGLDRGAGSYLVCPPHGYLVSLFQIAKNFDQVA